jgi:short-subunit dehydrogenase
MTMKQTALITGASSGIGYDLAHLFAADGHDLILVARSEGKLRDLAGQLEQKHNIAARVIPADLERPEAPRRLFASVDGPVDFLVNNAGFGLTGKFAGTDLERELAMIQVNVTALTHLTKLFLGPMIERGRGRILNVASTAAFQPGPLMAVYYATKAYVLSFSEAVAEELGGTGVTVTALCPGPTATGFATAAKMTNSRLFSVMKPMTSAKVARIGYNAMNRGKRVVITGTVNKVLAQSVRVTPRKMVTKVTRALQENR